MVAVKTGMTPPPMPGMPAPMQPMGGLPPMPPMGGGALAPNPFAPLPPMPLAGMPPPPPMMQPPMARPPMPQQVPQQQGSNAPRRKRFGDSLEGMLGRNQGLGAAARQRPLPMPPQMMPRQQMVAPGTPMMRTPTPRPMNQGGIVQGFAPGGIVQAIMDDYGYSEADAQAMYDAVPKPDIDPAIVEAYTDSLAAVQGDIAERKANIIPDAVAGGILTEEQAQAAIDASKANILAQVEALQASDASPFVDVVPQEGGIDYTSSEVIDATGGIFGDDPYATHYGVNRPAYLDALAAAEAALTAPPPPEPQAAPAPAPQPVPAPAPVPEPVAAPIPEPAPAPAPTGADAGPGTAVSAPANFGTGAYTPAPVNPSEVNPIDYTQFTGDIGNFSGTPESSALFGPKINIPQSVSQYYTDPTTGGLTTSYGPEMVATSPIGAIKLPARPVDIDIFDFLSKPTYGSLLGNEAEEMAMGGAVPRQTNIAGQPHMLSYINQDEEALLRSFGGSGIAGPGGIPSYPPSEYSAGQGSGYTTGTGSSNFDSGYTSSASKRRKKAAKAAAAAEAKAAALQQVIDNNSTAAQQTPSGKMDFGDEDYTPTSDALNAQLSGLGATNITTNFSPVDYTTTATGQDFTTAAQADTDVSGAEYVALTSGSPAPVTGGDVDIFTPTLGSEEVTTTYTDMLGNTHSSAADRDKANLGIQQQMYGSGNQASRNVQQELYKQYAERFPEGKRMEGDSEKLGQMAADAYLEYAPQINELLGPQGLPNQPFNLPFSFSGIEGITPRGSDTAPDAPDRDTTSPTVPGGRPLDDFALNRANFRSTGLFADPDVGLGPGSGYPDMSMTAIPGATTPIGSDLGYFPEDPGTGFPSTSPAPDFVTGTSGGGSSKDPNQFPVEEIQSIFSPKASTGGSNKSTDADSTSQYRPSVNAAEAAFLQEALGEFEFNDDGKLVGANPNFLEQVFGKIIKNLTFNMYDPNDPQKGEDAKAILDAYKKTGKFVYDGKQMSLEDLENRYSGKKGDPDYKNLQAGIEPAVIGVEGADGSTVGFDDGTGFRNIMGDYNPVYSEDGQVFSGGSDTQNILTGSTNVFGDNTNTNNTATKITTGGGDDDTTDDVDLGHTVDEDGNKVCNTEGYVYNPETKICEPAKEEEEVDGTPGSGINTGISGESFDDVLKRVVRAAPNVAPISANVQPMQEGGMAGLNRAADNFLQALAG